MNSSAEHLPPECQEVLSVARGDARDEAAVRDHLALCAPCRDGVAAVRSLARIARAALAEAPLPGHQVAFRRPDARLRWWSVPAVLGAAAAAAVILFVAGGADPTDPGARWVLELDAPTDRDSLPYRLLGPDRELRGGIPLEKEYVLETMTADLGSVDTF